MASLFGSNRSSSSTDADTKMRVQTSLAGLAIPVGWGQFRASWNLLDYDDFRSWTVSQGGKGGGGKGGGSYNYSATVVGSISEGPISVLNVWNGQALASTSALGMTIVSGSYSQSAWSYMATAHSSKADTYRGIGYAAASNMGLGSSPTLPNLTFEVLNTAISGAISGYPDADPRDVFVDAATNPHYGGGYPASQLATLNNYSAYCRATGLVISPYLSSSTSLQSLFSDLLDATNSDARMSSGILDIIPRGDQSITANGATYTAPSAPVYDLTDDDFLPSGDPSPIKITRQRASDQKNDVSVQFQDRSLNYNSNTARAFDDAAIARFGRLPLSPKNFPFFCIAAAAQMSAQLILGRQYYRNQYSFSVGRRFARLDCLDIISLTHAGQLLSDVWVKITGIDRQTDGTFSMTAEDYLPGTGAAPIYGVQSNSGTQTNFNVTPGSVNAPVTFTAPYQMADSGGLEYWIVASGSSAYWGGCQVWISADNTQYTYIGDITSKARQGVLTATLASGSDPDTTHTLAVNMSASGATVVSASSTIADANQNLAYVDGEVVSFGTATLTGTNTYNITYLRRGVYGTANASHASGTKFAVLDNQGLLVYPFSRDQIGKTFYLKFLSYNIYKQALDSLGAVSPVTVTLTGAPTAYAPISPSASPTIRGILVAWTNAPNVGFEAVEIWRSYDATFAHAAKIDDAPLNAISYEDKTVVSNTPYWYWVRYRDIGGGFGGYSPSNAGAGATATSGQAATNDIAPSAATNIRHSTVDGVPSVNGNFLNAYDIVFDSNTNDGSPIHIDISGFLEGARLTGTLDGYLTARIFRTTDNSARPYLAYGAQWNMTGTVLTYSGSGTGEALNGGILNFTAINSTTLTNNTYNLQLSKNWGGGGGGLTPIGCQCTGLSLAATRMYLRLAATALPGAPNDLYLRVTFGSTVVYSGKLFHATTGITAWPFTDYILDLTSPPGGTGTIKLEFADSGTFSAPGNAGGTWTIQMDEIVFGIADNNSTMIREMTIGKTSGSSAGVFPFSLTCIDDTPPTTGPSAFVAYAIELRYSTSIPGDWHRRSSWLGNFNETTLLRDFTFVGNQIKR